MVENVNALDAGVSRQAVGRLQAAVRARLATTHRLIRDVRLVGHAARQGGRGDVADVRLEVRGMGDSVGILPINAVRSPTTAATVRRFVVTHADRDSGQSMSILHCWYCSAQYPVLRPEGEDGWSPAMQSETGGRRITLARFCTQQILGDAYLTSAGRLFGEWLCDNASRLLDERLSYVERNQRRLVPYSEIRTAAGARGRGRGLRRHRGRGRGRADRSRGRGRGNPRRPVNTRVEDAARGALPGRTILPASFTASPRWYRNYLEDALALGARLGSPTFFVTLTANRLVPSSPFCRVYGNVYDVAGHSERDFAFLSAVGVKPSTGCA